MIHGDAMAIEKAMIGVAIGITLVNQPSVCDVWAPEL
jgi:hypothetical protein